MFALETCPPVATDPSQGGRGGEQQRQRQMSDFTETKDDATIKCSNIAVAWH